MKNKSGRYWVTLKGCHLSTLKVERIMHSYRETAESAVVAQRAQGSKRCDMRGYIYISSLPLVESRQPFNVWQTVRFCFLFFHCKIRGTECNNWKAFVLIFFTQKLGDLNLSQRECFCFNFVHTKIRGHKFCPNGDVFDFLFFHTKIRGTCLGDLNVQLLSTECRS